MEIVLLKRVEALLAAHGLRPDDIIFLDLNVVHAFCQGAADTALPVATCSPFHVTEARIRRLIYLPAPFDWHGYLGSAQYKVTHCGWV